MSTIQRISLCFLILALCSCNAVKKPLQPVLDKKISHIEIAKVESGKVLMIQQINPVIAAMGSSGLLLDTVIVAQRARFYKNAAGPVNEMCTKAFEKALIKALANKGIKANYQAKPYWDYFKGKEKENTKQIPAILKIELKNVGFWSKSPMDPYRPAIMVVSELINPVTREILYNDQFTLGIDITSLQVMKFLFGNINMLPSIKNVRSYEGFTDLLDQPRQSRDDLLKVVSAAAQHVAKSLNGEKDFITKTYAQTAAQVKITTTDNMIVAVDKANIRKSPSRKGDVLLKLNKGDVVTKMSKRGKWYYVRLQDGSYAWGHHSIFLKRKERKFLF